MPDYKTTREALDAGLARYGLVKWTGKLPPEFVLAVQSVVAELVEKELKDKK